MKTKKIKTILDLNILFAVILISACMNFMYEFNHTVIAISHSNGIENINNTGYSLIINTSDNTYNIINFPLFIALFILIFNICVYIANYFKNKSDI